MKIIPIIKKIQFQGLDAWMPGIVVTGSGYRRQYISKGDPLVFRKDAKKYAELWAKECVTVGYVTQLF